MGTLAEMQAAIAPRYGPPEVVRVVDVPRPATAADELLVRVRATTVNRTDCGVRAAKPFFIRAFTGLAARGARSSATSSRASSSPSARR